MTDFNRICNVDVIGMDIAFPGGEGLAGFGRIVYRGLPMQGQFEDENAWRLAAERTLLRTFKDAGVMGNSASVITLSPSLTDVIRTCLEGSQVYDVSTASNPLMEALLMADDWLAKESADTIVLVESQTEPQMFSTLVLGRHSPVNQNKERVYAVIGGLSQAGLPLTGSSLGSFYRTALEKVAIRPEEIGLIVTASLASSGFSTTEAQALSSVYRDTGDPACALSGGEAGLAGLIKAIWCLYQRVIPGTPDWKGPSQPEIWEKSAYYAPVDSRTWFCTSRQKRRVAAFHTVGLDGSIARIGIKEEPSNTPRPMDAAKLEPFYLFPLAAESMDKLVEKITGLKNSVLAGLELATVASQDYREFLVEKATAKFLVGLLGHTPDELKREIGFALTGITAAYEKKSDWQTPLGSYFTSQPLGDTGGVAFVYPGAFNSYPGVGQDLFYLFPALYDRLNTISSQMDEMLHESLLYPRSLKVLTPADLRDCEARLTADPLAMLISGTSLSTLYTFLLRDVFELHPASAFGYSLGEISMMFAGNVWTNPDEASAALRAAPLFRTRLSGPQDAIREYWRILQHDPAKPEEPLWENDILMSTPEKVRFALAGEPWVYLTHINTPRQVVIGGDPAGCQRVIASLKCSTLKAPFNYALHNEAIASEQDSLEKLLSWPVNSQPDMTLYSAASGQPMPVESSALANQIARGLCTCLNFPRLIQQVYQNGARIFIELGAGSNCARWIDDSLVGQPHAAFSINRKGVDDYSSVLRLMARLTCHRIPVNLSLLYK